MPNLPLKIEKVLKGMNIRPDQVAFFFISECAPDGMTGESCLLFSAAPGSKGKDRNPRVLLFSASPLGEFELASETTMSKVKAIIAEKTFLMNLRLTGRGVGGEPLFVFEIPSLQYNDWSGLISSVEECFPGKIELVGEVAPVYQDNQTLVMPPLAIESNPMSQNLSSHVPQHSQSLVMPMGAMSGDDLESIMKRMDPGTTGSMELPGSLPNIQIAESSEDASQIIETTPMSTSGPQDGGGGALSPGWHASGETPVKKKPPEQKNKQRPVPKGAPLTGKMVQCRNCGTENAANYTLCISCGAGTASPPAKSGSNRPKGIQGSGVRNTDENDGCFLTGCMYQLVVIFLIFMIFSVLSSFFP